MLADAIFIVDVKHAQVKLFQTFNASTKLDGRNGGCHKHFE